MPTADFSVQFLVQRNSGSTVIKLTDSSTASTFSAGNFKVTYPDGSVVQNTDYDSPDISSVGGTVNYTLKVNSNNSPLTGNYTILYTIIADSSQDVESKTFNFEWVEPTVSITNTSDVTIPEVKFKDNTTYDQGNFTESYDTWTMSAAAPTTSDVSGSTASGDLSTGARELDVVFATNYYEGDYTPTVTTDFTYTSTVYSYLSVNWTKVATNTFSIKKSQTQAEIVALLNTYKDEISTGQKEEYDYVLSLYSHLIGRAETGLLDGSEDILNELLDYIETTSSYTYQSGPISAFTFISGGSGLSNVVEDLTPQLGGDLDAQENNITDIQSLNFHTTPSTIPTSVGSLYWNETDRTLDLIQNSTILQVGQELHIRVRNASGSTILDGKPVYSSGHTGVFPQISLAQSDTDTKGRVIGLTTEDIDNASFGFITTFGYVRGIKTNYTGTGDWGTTWAEGDFLYVSKTVAGQLTNVEPDVPHHADIIGSVGTVAPANGTILVNINRNKTLTELSDVNGTDPSATGDIAVWDNDNSYFDFTDNINPYKETASTGIISGGALSISSGDNTKFNVASGKGYIVDHTVDPPTISTVEWDSFSSQTVTNLATQFATDIAINASGDIVQQSSFTDQEVRSLILLGGLDHSNQTNISSTFSIQVPMAGVGSSLRELARAIGDINISGNVYSANGANLNIDKTSGVVFSYGRNNVNSETNPHKITTTTQSPVSFGYVFDDGAGNGTFTATTTSINPNNYDDGSGTLATVPTNKWSIQRFLLFANDDKTFIQYGTDTYNRKQDALDAVAIADFPALSGIRTALVRGYLIVQQGETDLTSTDTEFLDATKFGGVSSSGAGALLVANNLSDLDDAATARSNLGVTSNFTKAVEDSSGTGTYTIGTAFNVILTGATTTANLAASPLTGQEHNIKNKTSSTVTLSGNGKNIYTGSSKSSITILAGGFVNLFYDGTEWNAN